MSSGILVTPIAKSVPFYDNAVYVGVDAGGYRILEQNLPLAFAVGDFDSMDPDQLKALEKKTCCIRYPAEKDETDSELAIRTAYEKGLDPVILWGGLSKRLDHTIANFRLLMYQFPDLILQDESQKVFLLQKGEHVIKNEYTHCSFFVVKDAVVSLSGFLYNLNSRRVDPSKIYMVSNSIAGKEARVIVHEGLLLCIQSDEK